jgi:hypothetical protein
VDAITVAAGLGSGLEGCQPLFRARGTGGDNEDGCGRRSAGESNRLSWRLLEMLRDSVASLSGYGDLANGFMMPGTDIVNVKGKNMTSLIVMASQPPDSSLNYPSRDLPIPATGIVHLTRALQLRCQRLSHELYRLFALLCSWLIGSDLPLGNFYLAPVISLGLVTCHCCQITSRTSVITSV